MLVIFSQAVTLGVVEGFATVAAFLLELEPPPVEEGVTRGGLAAFLPPLALGESLLLLPRWLGGLMLDGEALTADLPPAALAGDAFLLGAMTKICARGNKHASASSEQDSLCLEKIATEKSPQAN
jgi:hypothetical protein